MMITGNSLIPFGFDVNSGDLCDVGSVSRGVECNCICPSCKTPLIARQGKINDWHFAHQSKNIEQKTEQPCDYSFAVSIRLMIKQLSSEGLDVSLPSYSNIYDAYDAITGRQFEVPYTITKSSMVTLKSVELAGSYEGSQVDIIATIKSFKLIIYITYQGRSVPKGLYAPLNTQTGVLELDAESLLGIFKNVQDGQYTQALKRHLQECSETMKWIYHPRKSIEISKLKTQIEQNSNSFYDKYGSDMAKVGSMQQIEVPQPRRNYKCVMCDEMWRGQSRKCPKCGQQIFTTDNI